MTKVGVSGENLLVETAPGATARLFRDVPQMADDIGAELYGIESKGASLEELFRRATNAQADPRTREEGRSEN